MKAGAKDYYYVHDHLYSPVALANSGGTILERYEYDAYRNPTIWNADFTAERDNSNYGNPYLFTGLHLRLLWHFRISSRLDFFCLRRFILLI